MHVSASEQRAFAGDGEIERRARRDGGVVHVAAVAAGRAAVDGSARGCHADDADHRIEREGDRIVPDERIAVHLAEMRAPSIEQVAAGALALSRAGSGLRIELDVLYRDLQRAARLGALHEDGSGRGIDGIPIDGVERVGFASNLVAEAVLRADADGFARFDGQGRGEFGRERVEDLLVIEFDHGSSFRARGRGAPHVRFRVSCPAQVRIPDNPFFRIHAAYAQEIIFSDS